MLFPMVSLNPIDLTKANELLALWGHKMGPISRPMKGSVVSGGGDTAFGLFEETEIIGVFVVSTLIRENVATRPDLNRSNTIELSRVVAARPGICRLLVRMFREFVLPRLPYKFAISYQDAKQHTGDLYRFDGWARIAASRSGPDSRSGRQGRSKIIWGWPANEILNVSESPVTLSPPAR